MTIDGFRLAALKLNSLPPADRAWLLGRLPSTARRKLSELLRELSDHRFSVDATTLSQFEAAGPSLVSPGKDSDADVMTSIQTAPVEVIRSILADEPDWAIGIVLGSEKWAWRGAFLQKIGAERRHRIAKYIALCAQLTSRVRQMMIVTLGRRIAEFKSPAGETFADLMNHESTNGGLAARPAWWRRYFRWTH